MGNTVFDSTRADFKMDTVILFVGFEKKYFIMDTNDLFSE